MELIFKNSNRITIEHIKNLKDEQIEIQTNLVSFSVTQTSEEEYAILVTFTR